MSRRWSVALLCLAATALLAGCQGGESSTPSERPDHPKGTEEHPTEAGSPEQPEQPEPPKKSGEDESPKESEHPDHPK